MSEDRAGYRTGADTQEPEQGTAPIIQLRRPFTQVDNTALDDAMAVLSGAGWKCLCYLIRHTSGYQQESVRLSIRQFCEGMRRKDGSSVDRGTGLSHRAVTLALQELHDRGMIQSDADQRSRTQVRSYEVRPSDRWRLDDPVTTAPTRPARATSAKSSEVAQTRLKSSQARLKSSLVEPQTRLKSSPLINKDTDRKSLIDKTDANASGGDVTVAPVSGKSPKTTTTTQKRTPRPRRLTDEQLAQHQMEQVYLHDLIEALKEVIHLKGDLPNPGRQKQDAKWFLTANDGQPAEIADVVACYRIIKGDPWWTGKPVGTGKLADFYAEYCQDREAFRRAHAPKATSGRSATTRRPRAADTYEHPQPGPTKFVGNYQMAAPPVTPRGGE